MSKLDSIYISGIRSFGIERKEGQKLKFFSPLTLFLGQNGCGKTTIIEAIKYSCTGELPGGTKSGSGFVSDPYMHHVPYVLGQIKLCIQDVRANAATVVRVMKSEKTNNGGLKATTLDSTLTYRKANGEQDTLSGRVADLNSMTIQLMGVPQAILNNVIFCHQEQSLWPLEDGSHLKKKFDDIFDSVRYNQCVDAIRKLIKVKEGEYKLLTLQVKYSKEKKEEIERKRVKLQDRELKFEKFESEMKENKAKLVPIDSRLTEICDLESRLLELQKQLSVKENAKQNVIDLQNSIKANLKTEFQGSDRELQHEINDFQERRLEQNKKLQDFIKRKEDFENSEAVLLANIQKKNVKLVQSQEEIKQYKNKILERNKLVTDLGNSLSIVEVAIETDEDAIHAISTIKESIQGENIAINELSNEFKQTNRRLQSEIDKIREKCVQTEQEIMFKKKDIRDMQKEQRDIKCKLMDLDVSDEKLKSFEKRIASIDQDLEALASNFNEEQLTTSIDNDKKQIKSFEENLEALEKDNKIMQKNSLTENELEMQNSDVVRRRNDVGKIKDKYFDEFKLLFTTIPESEVKTAVEKLRMENNRLVTETNSKINVAQKKVITSETELKHEENELKSLELNLSQNKSKVTQLCGSTEYNRKCSELQSSLNLLQKTKGELSSAKILYEKFINDIKEKKCCPVCSTDFNNQQRAVNDTIQTLQTYIQDIPTELRRVQEDLKKQDEQYTKILQLKPINDKIVESTTTNIPIIKDMLKKTRNDLDASRNALEQLQKDIEKPQLIVDTCGKVVSGATLIDQNNAEIAKSVRRISVLTSQLIPVNSNRSKQQTENEIENIKLELNSLRDTCEKNQKKIINNNKQRQDMRERKHTIVQKQLDLKKLMQGKPQLLERVKEIELKEEALNAKIDELNESYMIFKTDLEGAIDNMEVIKNKNEAQLKLKESEYNKHKTCLQEITKLQHKIENIADENLTGKFNTILEELSVLQLKNKEIVKTKEEVTEMVNKLNIELSNHEMQFRVLNDNKSLRAKRVEEQDIDKDLEKLRTKIGSHNYGTVRREKDRLNKEKCQIEKEIQECSGKKEEICSSIAEIREELEIPENKNINLTYKNLFIKHVVTKLAISNMDTYAQVLEKAIAAFHRTRMTQINKNIRQLWTQIYKGNDIDYIEIENEVSHVRARRAYKYRVMQKKNDTLLEMRGRCSAGQKVLACLIIRIALAETFSANCGILALDEPTTNLDRENINSLSESLANIINTRQAQRNFQLLVITHDEDFLRALKRVDSLRYYYKVTRNNMGCTVITSEVL